MKLICPQCNGVTKYSFWHIMNKNWFWCEHCGFYKERKKFISTIVAILIYSAMIGGGYYIGGVFFSEIYSYKIQNALGMLIALAIFLILWPLVALLKCSIANRLALLKHKKAMEDNEKTIMEQRKES